jgi:electron transfer flavoprotein alpha subunit
LVFAEHDNKELGNSTLNAVTAAKELQQDMTLLVLGSNADNVVSSASKIDGVSKVLYVNSPTFEHFLAEDLAKTLHHIVEQKGPFSTILAPSTNLGKSFFPRFAALLNVSPVTDVMAFGEGGNTFVRPMYAGNAIATVSTSSPTKCITVRTTAFEKASVTDSACEVESVDVSEASAGLSSFVSESVSKSERPELTSAEVVVSGGRGLKNGENFAILEALADKLGGAVGASRAAVDAGWVPNEMQVGQTGKVVAPNLYIAAGISGAIQHLSGMKDSKTIVAINKDEDAPIFQVADFGIVGDLFEVVPEMTGKLD